VSASGADLRELDTLRADAALAEPFLVEVLTSLVQTKSVNPGIYEAEMAARVRSWLEPTGARIEIVEGLPGRPSVGAVLEGAGSGPRLVLNGHMDTVPIDDESLWRVDPFAAVVEDGYLWGRGACDMKAGLTVQIAVAHYLARHRPSLGGSLVLHFAMGEECAEPGTLSLLEAGFTGDYGITTEPTDLRVATAERGLVFFKIRIKGRSIHASRSHLGVNPVTRLGPVLDVLRAYEDDIKKRHHTLLGSGICTPTVVRGGVKENAVADYCDLSLDRRLIPGETAEGELEEIRARLSELRERDPDFDFELSYSSYFAPAEIDQGSAFAKQVLATVEEVTGAPTEIYGTPFGSDVRNLVNDAGIEAVTFGAGNVAECHCPNERLSLDQLRSAALVTAKVAADLLAR
jgi:succinyl-diaminopimelate desuccinylase